MHVLIRTRHDVRCTNFILLNSVQIKDLILVFSVSFGDSRDDDSSLLVGDDGDSNI
jgi:hypothetical protein